MIYQILPNLFLSGIAPANCNGCLREHEITHILTVDAKPLDEQHYPCKKHQSHGNPSYRRPLASFVHVLDCFESNILEKLEECLDVMSNCLKENEQKLLVHW